jgi:uncharacterized membrane protein
VVDIVNPPGASPLRITVRPNCAVHRGEGLRTLAVAAPIGVAIGLAFLWLGAWPVVPFVTLALAALTLAVHLVERRAGNFERITVDSKKLTVDRHYWTGDEHFEFDCYWVQVIARQAQAGGLAYLGLRSHGREVAVGHDLTDDERATVGSALLSRLAWLKH